MKVLLSLALMMMATECLGKIHSLVPARVNAQESVACRGTPPTKVDSFCYIAPRDYYYYDVESKTCKFINYANCGGTKNIFDTLEDCQKTCLPHVCEQPQKTGSCKASLTRFFFNIESQECKSFTYGGCNGNANNFLSMQDCKKTCLPNVCELPQKSGPCKASLTRYFFDVDSQECEKFTYGGCKGNANNFHSMQDCKEGCGLVVRSSSSESDFELELA